MDVKYSVKNLVNAQKEREVIKGISLLTRTFIAILWGMWNYVSFNTMFSHHDYNYILKIVFTLPVFVVMDITMIIGQNLILMWYNSSINVSQIIFSVSNLYCLYRKFSNTRNSKITINSRLIKSMIRSIWC